MLYERFFDRIKQENHKKNPSSLNIHRALDGCSFRRTKEFKSQKDTKLTVERFFDRISHFIPENAIVIAETGVSMFAVAEVLMPKGVKFIGQVFYGSIGYTVGATLGVAVAARDRPVILFIGDGSFQVTAQDLSTMIRLKTTPVIFLLNNDGYTIERLIIDGPYNDVQPWKYHKLPEVFGGRAGYEIFKEGELEETLQQVGKDTQKELQFVELHLDRMDCTNALKKAGESMASSNNLSPK